MKKLLLLSLVLVSQQTFACISVINGSICTGDTVYKGDTYSQGAVVVGENPYTQQVTVRSIVSGNLSQEHALNLDITRGCLDNHCVGSTVYKGETFSQGAIVVAFNGASRTLTLRSKVSGNLSRENSANLDMTSGCLSSICVGDRVYKGSTFSQGAIVVGINAIKFSATVRSVVSGSLSVHNIYELQGGSQPQWPTYPPSRPPEPNYPRPEPRPPVPSGNECTVTRVDPSGMFIERYSRVGYTKGEACRDATDACSRDLKGRQSCNISR